MAKRARLYFTDLEYRYQDRYGIMPDYDYIRLLHQGYNYEEAGRIVYDERLHGLWEEMKIEHETGFRPVRKGDGCPF